MTFRTAARIFAALSLVATVAAPAAPPPVSFTSYVSEFDDFEARTRDMPADERVTAFHKTFDSLFPGLYAGSDPARFDRRIETALTEFPAIRPQYREVEQRFPRALSTAVDHFRAIFPDFVPPLPIYLVHSLGIRDGGSAVVNGRMVMLFGADVIARIHNDDSLQPFLEHELFHLEHARHFPDCARLWCLLWQEGLATYAASQMTPGASDHQLLLDQPEPIRPATDANWAAALCWMADRFDSESEDALNAAFTGGNRPPPLPSRFGYYAGMRVAAEAARTSNLPTLARLNNEAARPIVAASLKSLIAAADAPCATAIR